MLDVAGNPCSEGPKACDQALARAFAFLGKRWNGVILGTLALGGASFSEISRSVDGISDSMLSERLNELTVAGLMVRTVGDERPVSVTYTLSPAGQALLPALHELTKWAAGNLPVASQPADRAKARTVRPPALSR
jgi:DNA-binding HxlR family transcriptional regulator